MVGPVVTFPPVVTDASEALLLTHVHTVVGDKVVVNPEHIVDLPVMRTIGSAFSVIVADPAVKPLVRTHPVASVTETSVYVAPGVVTGFVNTVKKVPLVTLVCVGLEVPAL